VRGVSLRSGCFLALIPSYLTVVAHCSSRLIVLSHHKHITNYHIFSFVKFYMESANLVVWVKYGTGRSVKVSVPSGDDVSDLKKLIKGELSIELRDYGVSQIELCKPVEERKEGGEHKGGEETAYRPGRRVSTILDEGVGVDDENPILIRTTQQGI
jgi:hypothetical protein